MLYIQSFRRVFRIAAAVRGGLFKDAVFVVVGDPRNFKTGLTYIMVNHGDDQKSGTLDVDILILYAIVTKISAS